MAAVRRGEVDVSYLTPPQFGHRIIFHILRILPLDLSQPYVGGGDLCRAYAEAFTAGFCSERHSDTRNTSRAVGQRSPRVLQDVKDPAQINNMTGEEELRTFNKYVKTVMFVHAGRSFIMATKEGHIGLAPAAARPGDVLFVIFGCDAPMILRPILVPTTKRDPLALLTVILELKWQVVGSCYTPGLMNGEAIYGITGEQEVIFQYWAGGQFHDTVGLQNHHDFRVRWDPERMLQDVGIPVQTLVCVKRVSVELDALKTAGINVEMVRLI